MLLTKKFNNWLDIVIKKTALNSWWSEGPLTTGKHALNGLTNGDYIMQTSAANVNKNLDLISRAISAAKRGEIAIGSTFKENYLCVICLAHNLNRTINLEANNANMKLDSLLQELYALIPSDEAMVCTDSNIEAPFKSSTKAALTAPLRAAPHGGIIHV